MLRDPALALLTEFQTYSFMTTTTNVTPTQAPVPSSPPPDLSGLSGLEGLGGADGNLGALLSNPALMNMAQQFLQSGGMQKMMENPAFQNM